MTQPNNPSRLAILGVPIDNVTMSDTLARLAQFMASPGLKQVATVNPEFIMTAQRDPHFRQVLQDAALCLPDGIGVIYAARGMGRPLSGRVAGSELVYRLAEQAATAGWRLFLLGAAPGVADEAGQTLQRLYPGLKIAGAWAGSPAEVDNAAQVATINASEADLLYVAYGAPQQDIWINRNRESLTTVRVAMGVGGALDFITGRAVRAPNWVQAVGLEWLDRLRREPWRWRRMATLPQFGLRVARHEWLPAALAGWRRHDA